MAVDQREAEDDEQQQVGDGAGELQPGEDADLDDEGDDDEDGGQEHTVEAQHGQLLSAGFVAAAEGVAVTVTVGAGLGFAGLGGSTVSRGLVRGGWTTTPTMSSLLKRT